MTSKQKAAPNEPFCCFIGCGVRAEWTIEHGHGPDDYTESCSKHLGEMMTDAPEHRVRPLR